MERAPPPAAFCRVYLASTHLSGGPSPSRFLRTPPISPLSLRTPPHVSAHLPMSPHTSPCLAISQVVRVLHDPPDAVARGRAGDGAQGRHYEIARDCTRLHEIARECTRVHESARDCTRLTPQTTAWAASRHGWRCEQAPTLTRPRRAAQSTRKLVQPLVSDATDLVRSRFHLVHLHTHEIARDCATA